MKNYKVTNLRSGVIEHLNQAELFDRMRICKGNYLKLYSHKEISNTPLQDKLNKVAYSLLDIIVLFALSLALGVIGLEVLTNLI